MARFLFTVWSFPGDIGPHIAVALALRARGHEVALYTGARASETLALLGLRHFSMRAADEELLYGSLRHGQGTGLASSLHELIRLRPTLRLWLVDPIVGQVSDLEQVLDSWHPDAIVCDPIVWAPYLVLHHTRGIPVAILSWAAASMLSGPDAMHWGLGLRPANSPLRRHYNAAVRAAAIYANRDFRRLVDAVRARYGLPRVDMPITDYAGTMPLYMIASSRTFDYGRGGLPPSVHYIGHCAWAIPSEPPAWLAELPQGQPLAVATEGTIESGRPRLLQAVARGLADEPLHVLIKDAQILDPGRDTAQVGLQALAPNMRREGFVLGQGWQPDVLARADVVITNGGAGSVLAALAAGVPLVVVPTTWDKPENARRVVAAGAGLSISPRHCTPRRLRDAVRQILHTPSYRANALRLGATLTEPGGPERGADLLERMIGATTVPSRVLAPASVPADTPRRPPP